MSKHNETSKQKGIASSSDTSVSIPIFINLVLKYEQPQSGIIKFVDEDSGFVTNQININKLKKIQQLEGKLSCNYIGETILHQRIRKIGAVLFQLDNIGDRVFVESLKISTDAGKFAQFLCKSWVDRSHGERIFFDEACLPQKVPKGLLKRRQNELVLLKGDGTGERSGIDRIYDYDIYNDLGREYAGKRKDPDASRQNLGGSEEFPFPRRYRTGRALNVDSVTEITTDEFFVPLNDRFTEKKSESFDKKQNQNIIKTVISEIKTIFSGFASNKFRSFEQMETSYVEVDMTDEPGPEGHLRSLLHKFKDAFTDAFDKVKLKFRFPYPYVYNTLRKDRWLTDEEYGRQVVAGLHPTLLQGVKELPKSQLGPEYGPPESIITSTTIEPELLEGKTLDEAIKEGKIFMLDYHDAVMEYVTRINELENVHTYAPRLFLYSHSNKKLLPVAIELNLPNEKRAYTPKSDVYEWALAKTYFRAVDISIQGVYSHFVRAHGSVEPYIIATYRCLSASHPIYQLLKPHFKDTLQINAQAREFLICAGGAIETSFLFQKYGMEIASKLYKKLWRFRTESLPNDLINRNMAYKDKDGRLKLILEDYPMAVDGLLYWNAILKWVMSYCHYYYKSAEDIVKDTELQEWWFEIKTKGHPDVPPDSWPNLANHEDLANIITTIIWTATGYHAIINFSLYDYSGYMPNGPSLTRQPMTDRTFQDKDEFLKEYFEIVPSPITTYSTYATAQVLSHHYGDEVYIGDDLPNWFSNPDIQKLYASFSNDINAIGVQIEKNNLNINYPSRCGKDSLPYNYLIPKSEAGVTGRGVPTSISI